MEKHGRTLDADSEFTSPLSGHCLSPTKYRPPVGTIAESQKAAPPFCQTAFSEMVRKMVRTVRFISTHPRPRFTHRGTNVLTRSTLRGLLWGRVTCAVLHRRWFQQKHHRQGRKSMCRASVHSSESQVLPPQDGSGPVSSASDDLGPWCHTGGCVSVPDAGGLATEQWSSQLALVTGSLLLPPRPLGS